MYTGDKNMINVAIDGPAGAGKSTIQELLPTSWALYM